MGELESGIMVRAMIVDQGEYFRLGIGQSLGSEKDIDVVGDFGEVAAATAKLEQLDPQVVLMSVDMREMSGFQACEKVT